MHKQPYVPYIIHSGALLAVKLPPGYSFRGHVGHGEWEGTDLWVFLCYNMHQKIIYRWSCSAVSLVWIPFLWASQSFLTCNLASVLASRLPLSLVNGDCLGGTSEHPSYVPALSCSPSIDHKWNSEGEELPGWEAHVLAVVSVLCL